MKHIKKTLYIIASSMIMIATSSVSMAPAKKYTITIQEIQSVISSFPSNKRLNKKDISPLALTTLAALEKKYSYVDLFPQYDVSKVMDFSCDEERRIYDILSKMLLAFVLSKTTSEDVGSLLCAFPRYAFMSLIDYIISDNISLSVNKDYLKTHSPLQLASFQQEIDFLGLFIKNEANFLYTSFDSKEINFHSPINDESSKKEKEIYSQFLKRVYTTPTSLSALHDKKWQEGLRSVFQLLSLIKKRGYSLLASFPKEILNLVARHALITEFIEKKHFIGASILSYTYKNGYSKIEVPPSGKATSRERGTQVIYESFLRPNSWNFIASEMPVLIKEYGTEFDKNLRKYFLKYLLREQSQYKKGTY